MTLARDESKSGKDAGLWYDGYTAIAYDCWSRHRVQPVYLWGGLVLVLSGPLRILVGRTSAWHSLAAYLVG